MEHLIHKSYKYSVCVCKFYENDKKDGEHFNLKKENFHIAYFPFGKSGVTMAHL